MSQNDIIPHRQERDRFFKTHENSPLNTAQKAAFDGLTYYDYDEAYALTATVERTPDAGTAQILTTQNTIRNYPRYGRLHATINGDTITLTLFDTPHGFFIPFVDANAGIETYGGGRYIDAVQLDNELFYVDFNRAYNPFCVYNPRYDCPIPPAENRLSAAIRAGERLPSGDWIRMLDED